MRMPEYGPFGEIFLEANALAIVDAFFVNRSLGGCVESVLTQLTHLFFFPVPRPVMKGILLPALRSVERNRASRQLQMILLSSSCKLLSVADNDDRHRSAIR